jgi:hypothetical protein
VEPEQQIACLKRELAMRKNVYPKWVDSGRMKPEQAEQEIAAMQSVLDVFTGLGTTIPRLPEHLQRMIQKAAAGGYHGAVTLETGKIIADGSKYITAWACAYLVSDTVEAARRLEAVYRALHGVVGA